MGGNQRHAPAQVLLRRRKLGQRHGSLHGEHVPGRGSRALLRARRPRQLRLDPGLRQGRRGRDGCAAEHPGVDQAASALAERLLLLPRLLRPELPSHHIRKRALGHPKGGLVHPVPLPALQLGSQLVHGRLAVPVVRARVRALVRGPGGRRRGAHVPVQPVIRAAFHLAIFGGPGRQSQRHAPHLLRLLLSLRHDHGVRHVSQRVAPGDQQVQLLHRGGRHGWLRFVRLLSPAAWRADGHRLRHATVPVHAANLRQHVHHLQLLQHARYFVGYQGGQPRQRDAAAGKPGHRGGDDCEGCHQRRPEQGPRHGARRQDLWRRQGRGYAVEAERGDGGAWPDGHRRGRVQGRRRTPGQQQYAAGHCRLGRTGGGGPAGGCREEETRGRDREGAGGA
mmetsp:Transcript_29988/g.83709  ORF Transcript_29988/g.83709 Transcript_29988/m.83709 type:complete len:393 (-) Transcript_29988:162-1340(-)